MSVENYHLSVWASNLHRLKTTILIFFLNVKSWETFLLTYFNIQTLGQYSDGVLRQKPNLSSNKSIPGCLALIISNSSGSCLSWRFLGSLPAISPAWIITPKEKQRVALGSGFFSPHSPSTPSAPSKNKPTQNMIHSYFSNIAPSTHWD